MEERRQQRGAGGGRALPRSARAGIRAPLQVPRLARDHPRARRGGPVPPGGRGGGGAPPVHRVLRPAAGPRDRQPPSPTHPAGPAPPPPPPAASAPPPRP